MRAPEAAMVATGGGGPGLFTNSKPGDRKIVPDDVGDREVFKVVYVVLESQYQASLSTACKRINAGQPDVAVECSGYILEELRDEANFQQFKKDVEEANIFIGSLIFVQELADKVVAVVEPNRDRLDAVCVFPSMPAVMKLNKIGSFTMVCRETPSPARLARCLLAASQSPPDPRAPSPELDSSRVLASFAWRCLPRAPVSIMCARRPWASRRTSCLTL